MASTACICTLCLVGCATGWTYTLFTTVDELYVIERKDDAIHSLSISTHGERHDVGDRTYQRAIEAGSRTHAHVGVYYESRSFTDPLGDSAGAQQRAQQMAHTAVVMLRGLFHDLDRPVSLRLYNVPDTWRYNERYVSPLKQRTIKLRFYERAPTDSDLTQSWTKLLENLATTLHEATHARQDLATPDMDRDQSERNASMVASCYYAAAMRTGEMVYFNRPDIPHQLNPLVNASAKANNAVMQRFVDLFHGHGYNPIDFHQRQAVADECRRVLPDATVRKLFLTQHFLSFGLRQRLQ